MAEPDWSQLPKDLLQLISQKLDSDFYQLRFRSVCSSWRFSSTIPSKNHLLNLPSNFTFPSESNNNTSTYPISKRTIFLIIPPPIQQQTLNPFLIKIGPDSHGRTRLWNPLSRHNQIPLHYPQHIDFNQSSVYQLGHEFLIGNFPLPNTSESHLPYNLIFLKKFVVYDALHNGNSNCSVILTIHFSGKLAIFRSGDEWWTIMPEMPPMPYSDVCVFNGRPIAVDRNGRAVAVGPDLSLDLVAEAVFGGDRKLLVESGGELLLVDKYLRNGVNCTLRVGGEGDYDFQIERTVRFVVFRLDEKEKKWVELTSLGDRVLFLGQDCAFSVSASELCLGNGNCVIFRDDAYSHYYSTGLGIEVFCLDKQRILPLSVLPSCSNLFWPPLQLAGLFD